MSKKITIKAYRPTGEFIKNWDDATFEGFTKQLNGGLGECIIKLARKWDDYGEYEDVKLNNEIQILITDEDTIDTDEKLVRIYSGYISRYEPWVDGGKEGITITCLGYYTKLAQDIYKNGTTTTIHEVGTDIGVMCRNMMDRYIAETVNPKLHYALADITETSTTATYTFEMMTYQEVIDQLRVLAPANWWWYVNQYNELSFKTKPTSAKHEFIFGRHFSKVYVEKSMEKIKNALLFWNSKTDATGLYRYYRDLASLGEYGRRLTRWFDQDRIGTTDSTVADKIGDGYVAEHKDPDIMVRVEILDNNYDAKGYDIESIEPGDTCNFLGFNESLSETFKENMLITQVEYTLDKAIVTVEPMKSGIVNRIEGISTDVGNINSSGAMTDYNIAASSSTSPSISPSLSPSLSPSISPSISPS